jgi:hypothetical protein
MMATKTIEVDYDIDDKVVIVESEIRGRVISVFKSEEATRYCVQYVSKIDTVCDRYFYAEELEAVA